MSKAPWTAETRARRGCAPYVPPIIQQCQSRSEYHAALTKRNRHVNEAGMWPERGKDFPESLEETLRRVK